MAKQFVKDLKDGHPVDSAFSVKYKHPPSDYKSKAGSWFAVGVSDMTGEIEIRFWGGSDKAKTLKTYESFKEDDVIHAVGTARLGMDKVNVEIQVNEDTGKLEKTGSFNMEDFVPRTKQDIGKMLAEINSTIGSISDASIKALLESFFKDKAFVDGFCKTPGGITMHHDYVGGLLEHTVHVVHICKSLLDIHPQLDRDLLLSGAILHDIGKIREFRVTTNIKQTEDGMLRGHITIGQEMLLERIGKLPGFPEELKLKVAHIMLSHHGNGDYGSPVPPAFAEAEAIHYADECDTKLDQHITTKEDPRSEDFRTYSRKLRRFVYLK